MHTYYGREGEEISFEKWKQLQMADWAARQNDQEFVDRIGIWETVSLAKERFSQLAGDYVSFWSQRRGANSDIANRWLDGVRQLVVSETASLWAGTEWHSSWFERACRSKVLEGLGPLVQEWTSRVVELEIQHLQNPSIPLRSIVAAGGNLGIARQYDEAYRTISASRDLIKGYRRAHFGVADLAQSVAPTTAGVESQADQALRSKKKGDPNLIRDKLLVSFQTTELYLGISKRQRQKLIKLGKLEVKGEGHNRKITSESLRAYLPPESANKDEEKRTKA